MTIEEHFNFRIPDRLEELEDEENFSNFYTVNRTIVRKPAELSSRMVEAERRFKNQGPNFILETFDYFYFVIKFYKDVDIEVRYQAWTLLNRSMFALHGQLNRFINENFNLDQRRQQQNKLQMIVYAFVLLSDLFENDDSSISTTNNNNINNKDSNGNNNRKKKNKSSQKYDDSKHQAISTMLQIFSLRLDRVFETSHFLNNFINITLRWIYKIIENNPNRTRSSIYFHNICELITVALERYQHSINYCMKIIEILQNKENSAAILSDLVAHNIKRLPHLLLLHDIIDQIKSMDINLLSRDISAPKTLATFLIELGRKCTDIMFKHVSDLFEFLEQDSYPIRNATLEIIATIIINKFCSPTIFKDVHIKNKLLDKLEEHIHDIAGFTRGRVLQLWSQLAEHGAIPIERLLSVIDLIIGRLDDKSCYVRKYAIHFLTIILKDNTFNMMNKKDMQKLMEKTQILSDQFKEQLIQLIEQQEKATANNIDDTSGDSSTIHNEDDDTIETNSGDGDEPQIQTQKESRKRKSEEYAKLFSKKPKQDLSLIEALAADWVKLEKPLQNFWKLHGKQMKEKLKNIEFPDDLPQDDLDKGFEYFRNQFKESRFEDAFISLFSLKSLYPNEPIFQLKSTDFQYDSDDDDASGNVGGFSNDNDDIDDDDGGVGGGGEDDTNNVIFNEADGIFLSAMTNFKTNLKIKLPYELTMAKQVFLAPLIDFGNLNLDQDNQNNNTTGSQKQMIEKILSDETGDLITATENAITISSETFERALNKVKQYEALIDRLKLAIQITNSISKSIPTICILLNSRNNSDIQEAINFFTYAYRMEIDNALFGIQQMLKLIFSREKPVRDALMEAFGEIYLNQSADNGGAEKLTKNQQQDCPANKALHYLEVKNLSNMILKLNQGELICAEAIIKELYAAQKFNQIHLQILWERYAKKYSRITDDDSRAALIIIGMLASAQPSLIRNESNLNNIISISLEPPHCLDHRFVSDTCEVLLKAFRLPQIDLMERFFKLPTDHLLFMRLRSIIADSITEIDSKYWLRMSSVIIKVTYFLADKPDLIISQMIQDCYRNIMNKSKFQSDQNTPKDSVNNDVENLSSALISSQNNNSATMIGHVDDIMISRFISILGDVAINILIHLDLHLSKELKIRQYIKEKEKTSKAANVLLAKQKKAGKNSRSSSRNETIRNSVASNSIFMDDDDEETMDDDMIGPINDDPYQENIFKICNESVLFDKGILKKFIPLIERISTDYEGNCYSYCLRQSASLTLAKFMALSLNYTRKNRAILADILEKSKDSIIRSNAIISFGDLLVRFPNEMEHFTGKIFGCLMDDNFLVKNNALIVLTRLILADMIKPKGHISKIAQLVTDDHLSISSSARLFFTELGKKNNVYIYNYLPDIISNLSGQNGMNETKFQDMIKFLFELLEKTRNTESLVAKLCHRFSNTTDERTWRDLSYCLSLLHYNDRAMINLMNNFSCFANSLYCNIIFDNFMTILNNTRKGGSIKSESKIMLDEMESRIKEIRSKAKSNDEQNSNVVVEENDGQDENDNAANNKQNVTVTESDIQQPVKRTRTAAKKSSNRLNNTLTTTTTTTANKRRTKSSMAAQQVIEAEQTNLRQSKRTRRRIIYQADSSDDDEKDNDNQFEFNE
ncbi:CAP-D2 condensin subunit [Dermatophagoides pteronyssinus]|uniref:CAP-D2 condensin subunit n=1 Tax=Dermatophagoides pteronyssinus TaxID=6956 RepID=UPI003F67E19A